MTAQIVLTGMVLAAAPVGEYDKRLVLLTRERGRITAFARGARRPHSPYGAGSRPFSFGEFTVYQGRDAYTLAGINISNYFESMSMDLDKVYYGMYFLELAGYYGRENVEAKDMLNLLYASFTAVNKGIIPIRLIRYIYEMKLFAINGEYPQVFECNACRKKSNLTHFSAGAGGALCKDCSSLKKDSIRLDTSTFYTMQYIICTPIKKLYSFKVSGQVLSELGMVLGRWRMGHLDKEFKSLELIEDL